MSLFSGTMAQFSKLAAAQLASIRQMSRQRSRGSAGEYQADEQALFYALIFLVASHAES